MDLTYPACFVRDRFRCRHCNNMNGIHKHHIVYRSHQGSDELNNLLTLCHICHRAHHDGKLKIEVLEVLEDNLVVRFIRVGKWKPQ
jgi:5-methylcytosine-specific restriction endonuclease McrA